MFVYVYAYPGRTGKSADILALVKRSNNNFLLVIDAARKLELVKDFELDEFTADRILPYSSAESFFANRPEKPNIFIDDLDKILNEIISTYGQLCGVTYTRPWVS